MREPSGHRARPSGEMHQPSLDHPTHDLPLVAAHAAGDLPEADRSRAEALLQSCSDCTDLERDLLAIAAATRTLPAPAARTRDFQLSPEHADRLRRGSWLRAALRPFGATRSAVRPIAAAFTGLGIAGLLIAAALPGLAGSGAATLAPERDTTSGAGYPAATAAAAGAPGVPAPQAPAPTPFGGKYDANAHKSAAPQATDTAAKAASAAPTSGAVAFGGAENSGLSGGPASSVPGAAVAASPPSLLMIGSLALLAIGLVLFGLRFAGRRVR